jgi:hypothetical protein
MLTALAQVRTGKSVTRTRVARGVTLRVIETPELENYVEAWWSLSTRAIVPNPFYEPWMLLPATRSADPLVESARLHFVLIFGPTDRDGAEPLWGFFPLEIKPQCLGVPIRNMAFWQHHRYFYLTTPLIDSNHVWEVLEAFWRWVESNPFHCRILDTSHLLAEGPFHAVWADFAIGRSCFTVIDFPRAFLEPQGSSIEYIARAVSKKHSDEYVRLQRRLSELGTVEFRQVESIDEVDAWLDEFLRLEEAGWKGGADGRAFAKETAHAEYLRTTTRDGFVRNRVMLLSLVFDGKTIAMKHNLLSGNGSFAFKIAYDESFAKYSPGVLLELENIRRVCDDSRIQWMDSCASPRHVMANRIWSERRMIRRTLFSVGSRLGDLWVSLLPPLRWVKRQVRPEETASHFQISTRRQGLKVDKT